MYISPRLRGGKRFAGGSLVTFAAVFVRHQTEREGGDFVLVSFNNLYHIYPSPAARGESVCRQLS